MPGDKGDLFNEVAKGAAIKKRLSIRFLVKDQTAI